LIQGLVSEDEYAMKREEILASKMTSWTSRFWIDPIIGLRWTTLLSKRWKLRLRGDVGGFGVGSSFTGSGAATALFRMTERLELHIAYRAADVDYDNGKAPNNGFFEYNTTTHGALVGLKIES
jgi:hypothetical protein